MPFISPLCLSHSFTGVSIARGSPVLDESLFDCSGLYCFCVWLFVCFFLSVFIHYIYISVSVNVWGFVHLWFSLCKCYCLCFWFSSCVWTCYDQCSWQDMIILLTVFFFFCSFFSFCFHEVVARWEEIQVEEYTRAKISVPKTVLFFWKYHYFDEELKNDQAYKNRTNTVFWFGRQVSGLEWMNEWIFINGA